MRYIHPRVIMIAPADSMLMIGQIALFSGRSIEDCSRNFSRDRRLAECILIASSYMEVFLCILPLLELVEFFSTNPNSVILWLRELLELFVLASINPISAKVELGGLMELVELSLTEFSSAIAKLKKLVDFLPVVPAPAIVELRVTDVQLIPEDSMEQSRGNFNS